MPFGKLPEIETVGHATLPESVTLRDPPSMLVTSSDALFGPTDVGWKPTDTVASFPGPIVVVLGERTKNSAALAPEIANGGVSVTGDVALIVRLAPDRDPTAWVPKSMLDGSTVIPPVAVPLSVTITDPLPMVGTVNVPLCVPPLGGWNVTDA